MAAASGSRGRGAALKTRGSFAKLVIALIVAEMACSFESGMIMVALSQLYRQYGDPALVGWLVTAFTLASAASGGRLGDIYGRRRVVLICWASRCSTRF